MLRNGVGFGGRISFAKFGCGGETDCRNEKLKDQD